MPTRTMSPRAEGLIKRHEGKRNKPYRDSKGVLTIGYGYNLEKGVSDAVVDLLFDESMRDVYADAAKLPWFMGSTRRKKNRKKARLFCTILGKR